MTRTENPYLDKTIDTSFLLNPLLLSIQSEFEPHNPENFKNRYLMLRDNKTQKIRIVVHSHQNDGRLNSQIQEHKEIRDQYLLGRGQALADYTLLDAGYLTFDFNRPDNHIHIKVESKSSTLSIKPGMIDGKTILPYFQKWASDFKNIVWEAAPYQTTDAPTTHLYE